MAGTISTRVIKDGNGTAFPGGGDFFDVSGSGAGPWVPVSLPYDPTSSNVATIKGPSIGPVATDTALVVSISPNSINANGQATMANSAPIVIASNQSAVSVSPPLTTDISVTPTVSTAQYTSGNVIGGPMVFSSILASNSFNGILHSITAKFKGTAVTGTLSVAIFKSSALAGTYSDHGAPTFNSSDMQFMLGTYQMTSPLSVLGTMTTYNLDGIGKALVGSSLSLTAVAVINSSPTPATPSDFTLELSVLPG